MSKTEQAAKSGLADQVALRRSPHNAPPCRLRLRTAFAGETAKPRAAQRRRLSYYLIGCLILTIAPSALAAERPGAPEKIPPVVYRRAAFLGDSITDGDTYPQLVRIALADAGLPKLVAINAGIGGDTARGMRARLERDVLAYHPTLVTLSVGANDAMRNVSAESYEQDVRAIADRLKKEGIELIILTPNIIGPKVQAKGQKNLDTYEQILRRIAADGKLRVAEVNQREKENAAGGHQQLAPDDIHPNFDGQGSIARAVLDAMRYVDVKVPGGFTDLPFPGVISRWKVWRSGPKDPGLTEAAVALVKPDDSWLTLSLPETQPMPGIDTDNRWLDGYRALGASVALRQQPAAGKYIGVATVHSNRSHTAQFHTGGDLEQIWLNGKLIYQNLGNRGYHIGRESVDGELKEGDNTVVIKTGPVFFLSVTDGAMW